MSDLKGKVAFITGGGSGIGRGIAERLARDGADIFIADIDSDGAEMTANLVTQLGRRAVVTKANVARRRRCRRPRRSALREFGRLDIAVANAGIGRGGSVLEMDLKDWNDQLDINLTGVFLTVQATAQQMVKLGNGGRIVCISSLGGGEHERADVRVFGDESRRAHHGARLGAGSRPARHHRECDWSRRDRNAACARARGRSGRRDPYTTRIAHTGRARRPALRYRRTREFHGRRGRRIHEWLRMC